MNIKLIAIDIDGTLLDSAGNIQESTKVALAEIQKMGVKIVLATGRSYEETIPYARQIGATEYFILFTGGLLIDRCKKVFYKRTFPAEDISQVIEIVNNVERDVYVEVYTEQRLYVKNADCLQYSSLPDAYKSYIDSDAVCVGDFEIEKVADEGLQKIFVGSRYEKPLSMLENRIAKNTNLHFMRYKDNTMEILGEGAEKGKALRILSKHLGFESTEIAVIGDSNNDLSMFDEARISIAMGNGFEKLRAKADFVTASNDNDGINKAIAYILQHA